jgi:WD40 repeat protein
MTEQTVALTREQRLDDVIARFLQAEKEGQAPTLDELVAEHPDLAAELKEFFADRSSIQRLAAPVRAALTELTAGTTVRYFGDYEILGEIARGGMGVVYRARQVTLNRPVALKMILAGQLASPADVARFRSEAEAAAGLDHPNIMPIYEINAYQEQHYFSMKLVEGGSLANWLAEVRAHRTELTPQDQANIARLVETVARAVHFGHQRGILHRDLKPANILLQLPEKATAVALYQAVPVVTDFGLAKRIAGGSDLTAPGAIVGTPSYMAPEQASGEKALSTAADVYSLGAILYELLTGQPPFRAATPLKTLMEVRERDVRSPRTLDPRLNRDLETICLKSLEKDPHRRYGSAEAQADDLRRWQAGEPVEARPSTAWERTVKWARRRPALASLVGVSAAAIAALLLGGAFFNAQLQVALADVGNKQAELDRANDAARKSALLAKEREVCAEGTLLTAHSAATRPDNPGLALLLAIEGARRAPGFLANNALLAATDECRETRTFLAHTGPLFSAAFSPDGRRVVSCSADKTARVWDAATGKELYKLPRHEAQVVIAQFSPDGRVLLTISAKYFPHEPGGMGTASTHDVKAHLWHADDGKPIAQWQPGPNFRPNNCLLTAPFRVGFSPDSGRVVTCFGLFPDCFAYVHDTATGKELLVLKGHEKPVLSAKFSPDGKKIVTASLDETARVWDAATGNLLHTLKGHACGVLTANFSPDSKLIVTTGDGSNYRFSISEHGGGGGSSSSTSTMENVAARIWDAETGKEVAALRWPGYLKAFVRNARFSPDGRRVLTFGNVGNAIGDQEDVQVNFRPNIWDAATGKLLVTLKGQPRTVVAAEFSANGRLIATAGKDKTARVWDAATGEELFVLRGHENALYSVSFSPDSTRLVTSSEDRTARVWSLSLSVGRISNPSILFDGRIKNPSNSGSRQEQDWLAIWQGTFSPDGKRLYLPPPTPSHAFTARILDTATGKELARAENVKWMTDGGARFSPDGRKIVTGDWSGHAIHLLDSATLKEVHLLGADSKKGVESDLGPAELQLIQRGHIGDMTFSPDSLKLVTADGKGRIGDVVTGKLLHLLDGGPDHAIHAAVFSPDSQRIATIFGTRAQTSEPITEGITREGKRVLMTNPKCTARIWDVASGKELMTLRGHGGQILVAAWSPDGRRLVTGAQDNTVRLWDTSDGKELYLLRGHTSDPQCAALSPDGRTVATGSADKTARVWDVTTGKQKFVLIGHDAAVHAVAFSPRGELLLTGSDDGSARLWDAETGKELALFKDQSAPIDSVVFSTDGQKVLATLRGEIRHARLSSARIWPVDLLAAAMSRKPRELTAAERKRFEIEAGE